MSTPTHSVGNVPCPVCKGDHRDPKDKIIADLLAALRHQTLRGHQYVPGACSSCERAESAIAVAEAAQ